MTIAGDHDDGWVRPTTGFWQRIDDAAQWNGRLSPPYRYGYPASLPDGGVLELPIRRLANEPHRAVASLIANQASFEVVARLAEAMTVLARPMEPTVVVGLPTLGMAFAPPVAQALGHTRWVPLGYSRKFWYDDALSAPVASLTTPAPGKHLYLDPNQLPLVRSKRVLIVDDAVSSGMTLRQSWDLLERIGAEVTGVVVAMRQGTRWRETLGGTRSAAVHGVFDSPLLELREDGWWP